MRAVVDAMYKFRKKYTLALLLYVSGTALAFTSDASLGEYTAFAGILLAIFGSADIAEKMVNKE